MDTFKRILKNIGKFLNKIKVLLILAVIAFIVVTFIRYGKNSAEEMLAMATASQVETAQVENRDIMQTITATGTIESSAVRTLSSTIVKDTKITAVNCEVGDYVEEGDVLVTFSYEEINKTISQLQEDIVETEATQAITNSSNERQYYYSYGTENFTIRDLQTTIDERKQALDYACQALSVAKSELEYERNKEYPEGSEDARHAALVSKEQAVTNAQQNVDNAQNAYDRAVQAMQDEIYKGSNTLAGATENYQKSTLTAGDSAKSLKRQLETYQDKLDDYVITAPISGTVTSVKVEENNSFSGGDMVTIQDCSILFITTQIDEYDIPDIKLGQKVVIKTDATRDDELDGIVTEIAPVATASASAAASATYSVKIQIITSDERLKLGMTAKLSIILDEVRNTLSVPYNAIEEKEDGTMVVYALKMQNSSPSNFNTVGGNKSNGSDGVGNISKTDDGDLIVNGEQISLNPVEDAKEEGPKKEDMNLWERTKHVFKVAYGKKDDESEKEKNNDRYEIPVTVGMESDYYTQISGEGIEEGLTVVIPESDEVEGFDFMMFGPGGM